MRMTLRRFSSDNSPIDNLYTGFPGRAIRSYRSERNVRFGSAAVIQTHSSPMAALGRIADVRERDFRATWSNDRFRQYRTFRLPKPDRNERQLSAISGQ